VSRGNHNLEFFKNHIREATLLVVYVLVTLPQLGYSYVQPTDPVWVQRGIQFYEAFRHFNFAQTYTKYHPGVPLMWITGISYKIFYAFQKIHFGYVRDLFLYQVDLYSIYSFIAKFFIALVIMVILLYCYIVIRKYINSTFAFWTIFFIITEPFVIGNIRSIHVDALAAFFMFAAVISFWALQVEKSLSKKYLVLVGVFTGLALLTKISSIVLFPFFVVVAISYFAESSLLRKEGRIRNAQLQKTVISSFMIFLISVAVFYVLFPAMWVGPVSTVQKIISDGFLDTALNEESSRIVFLGWDVMSFKYKYVAYLIQLAFRTTPALLILVVVGLIAGCRRILSGIVPILSLPKEKGLSRIGILLFYSLIFIFGYYLMISISDKKIFRYILPMYPFLAIFASYGIRSFLGVSPSAIRQLAKAGGLTPIGILILYHLWQPISVSPNFFAYFNPLLGGIKNASKVISLNQDATGYYIVGEYLNQKPNAEEITVGCYDSGPMRVYFRGYSVKLKLTGLSEEYLKDMDYILLPVQEGWQYLPKEEFVLEKVFRINNFDYWYLFNRTD